MTTQELQYRKRLEKFDGKFLAVKDTNPIVYRFIEEYCRGHIHTYEEALCQMIFALTTEFDKNVKDYITYEKLINYVPRNTQ